jgi:hypothetical protein
MAQSLYSSFDPLAQSFDVPVQEYPNGIFVSSCDIFFASKDTDLPVSVEIRYVNLGVPSKDIVPLSQVTKNPNQVNTSNDGTVATTFTFESPVYLAPKTEYAIIVFANTDKYNVYVSVLGENDVTSGKKITKQPTLGSLFKSQNASTWTPEQFKDLKYVLRRCNFTTGSGTIDFISEQYSAEQKFASSYITASEKLPSSGTSIAYESKTRDYSSNTIGSFEGYSINQNAQFNQLKKISYSANSEFTIRATLTTDDNLVSPIIDATKFGGIVVKNIVSNANTYETNSSRGLALSKYITKRINLADGFDATGIKVFLDVNRPPSTDIKVYYKILSHYDYSVFDDRPYVEISKVDLGGGNSTTKAEEFIEEQYYAENVKYTGLAGGKYTDFKTFAIKIVFLSTDEGVVPRIRNLRAIALA